jgi:catechol 2,3-dioxygenase-like lactoylglutathione lyase family enzyme
MNNRLVLGAVIALLAGASGTSPVGQETESTAPQGTIRGVHHVAISTGDLERAIEFYEGLLGFKVVVRFAWPVGIPSADLVTGLKDSSAKAVILRAGNTHIEIFEYSSPTPKPGDPDRPVCDHGITHIALDVIDIDAVYERLKAAGMRFHCPPQPVGGETRATYGRDPDGNVIEIQELPSLDSPLAIRVY